jgi:hypothetical protein
MIRPMFPEDRHLSTSKGWRNGKIIVMNHGEDKRLWFE